MTKGFLSAAALALALTSSAAAPAFANGAASTRNILLGGAAAAAGTFDHHPITTNRFISAMPTMRAVKPKRKRKQIMPKPRMPPNAAPTTTK
jgi:hypothetical protein